MEQLTSSCTVEDVLEFKKADIQQFLRFNGQKVSGSKLELANRTCTFIKLSLSQSTSVSDTHTPTCSSEDQVCSTIPSYSELNSGWTSDKTFFPNVSHKDVENYLISSNHRTVDQNKMECYRQYIRGFNFFKEGYVHKVMINTMNDEIPMPYCYIRSKCYPSMKDGVYIQWVLVTKNAPFTVKKAYCSCPAGLGEGCAHIAGLLFKLEDFTENRENEDATIASTSKPQEWGKPAKRAKVCKSIDEIQFKRIRYGGELKKHILNPRPKKEIKLQPISEKCSFREKLCARLPNTRAVLFDILEPSETPTKEDICSDLNVGHHEEVETSEQIIYESDKYINLKKTIKDQSLDAKNFINLVTNIKSSVVDDIEFRTRGQAENPLWKEARNGRITASNFHDIKTRKPDTPPANLVRKLLNENDTELSTPALKWGRKMEPIAKKCYKATKKLKSKQNVVVLEKGLFVSQSYAYLGASPDGIVRNGNKTYLIEVKCPYKHRGQSVENACEDSTFCCYLDKENKLQLKKSHKYYTQIQGQMAICKIEKCELVIYTSQDLKIIEILFDQPFWDELLEKLKAFYTEHMIPSLMKC